MNAVGKSFQILIRNYNNALAFSSLGVTIDQSVAGQLGIYTFRIQGELVHRIGSLLPNIGEVPRFAQIHIHDSTNTTTQAEIRMAHQHGRLNETTLLRLTSMLDEINPYFHNFRTASERSSMWRIRCGGFQQNGCRLSVPQQFQNATRMKTMKWQ